MEQLVQKAGEMIWSWPLLGLFLGVGILYTIRLRGIQFRFLGRAFKGIFRKNTGRGISPYGALCTALAATIGTGNIVGVATAVTAGGPGALFWMLVAAVFGMATQYAECFLASRYKKSGGFGGPFLYIGQGLGKKYRPLGKIYAFLGAAAGLLGVGTVTQVNSITSAVDSFFGGPAAFGDTSWATVISGALVAGAAALVLIGGIDRISSVCQMLVPLMSAVYVMGSLIILCILGDRIPAALGLIFRSAWNPQAALGAAAGIGFRQAVRMGVGRGVFTNEAGLGTSAIAAAASGEEDPAQQGLVSMTGTFIDTIIICSMTGLCLIVTDAWRMPLEGIQITDYAWRTGLPWKGSLSSFILMASLVFFAFATIIGWNFYAEQCLTFLTGGRGIRIYRLFYILTIAAAPYYSVRMAWETADILNALLAVPNLLALLLLQNQVVEETGKRLPMRRRKPPE